MRTVWLGLLLFLASCATFESGDLPGLERWPPQSAARRVVDVQMDGLPQKFQKGWQRGAVRALEDWQAGSGAGGAQAPKRTLLLHFEHSRQDIWLTRIWMGFCAFSGAVIPARTEQFFDLRAEVLDESGRQLGVVERSVSGATWVGWLPLFALPFAGGGLGELVQDTMRSVVVEAAEKGWL